MEASQETIIESLFRQYAHALDRHDMPGWLACFAEDGSYLCQTRENHEEGMPVGIMRDDGHARLRDRVKAVDKVWAGTAEEYRTRHFHQQLECTPLDGGMYEVVSNFVVYYTTNRGDCSILAAGQYLDRIRIRDGVGRFVSRRAILDQQVTPRYLVYPV